MEETMAKKIEMDNLAKDAAKALAADMSYGRWKALHPYTKDIEEEPAVPEGLPICKRCGKPFKPRTYRKQMYCEYECQQAAAKERDNEKRKEWYRTYMAKKRAEMAGVKNG
jgi:hypothetical protein